jgi:hypothetical protein
MVYAGVCLQHALRGEIGRVLVDRLVLAVVRGSPDVIDLLFADLPKVPAAQALLWNVCTSVACAFRAATFPQKCLSCGNFWKISKEKVDYVGATPYNRQHQPVHQYPPDFPPQRMLQTHPGIYHNKRSSNTSPRPSAPSSIRHPILASLNKSGNNQINQNNTALSRNDGKSPVSRPSAFPPKNIVQPTTQTMPSNTNEDEYNQILKERNEANDNKNTNIGQSNDHKLLIDSNEFIDPIVNKTSQGIKKSFDKIYSTQDSGESKLLINVNSNSNNKVDLVNIESQFNDVSPIENKSSLFSSKLDNSKMSFNQDINVVNNQQCSLFNSSKTQSQDQKNSLFGNKDSNN